MALFEESFWDSVEGVRANEEKVAIQRIESVWNIWFSTTKFETIDLHASSSKPRKILYLSFYDFTEIVAVLG